MMAATIHDSRMKERTQGSNYRLQRSCHGERIVNACHGPIAVSEPANGLHLQETVGA